MQIAYTHVLTQNFSYPLFFAPYFSKKKTRNYSLYGLWKLTTNTVGIEFPLERLMIFSSPFDVLIKGERSGYNLIDNALACRYLRKYFLKYLQAFACISYSMSRFLQVLGLLSNASLFFQVSMTLLIHLSMWVLLDDLSLNGFLVIQLLLVFDGNMTSHSHL